MAYANIRGGLSSDPQRRELLQACHMLHLLRVHGDGQTDLDDLLPFAELDAGTTTTEPTPYTEPTDEELEAQARAMLANIRDYAGRVDARM